MWAGVVAMQKQVGTRHGDVEPISGNRLKIDVSESCEQCESKCFEAPIILGVG